MQKYINICHDELERRAAYLEKNTANFEKVAKITIDSDIENAQEEEMGVRTIYRRIFTMKMRQIRVLRKTRAKKLI